LSDARNECGFVTCYDMCSTFNTSFGMNWNNGGPDQSTRYVELPGA
jgi:hypothetical protein